MKRHIARVTELGRSGADTVIPLINVDDPTGNREILADLLMPGENWQQYRDRGQTPVVSGVCNKAPFPSILTKLGYGADGKALAETSALQVVVLHAETVQLMEV